MHFINHLYRNEWRSNCFRKYICIGLLAILPVCGFAKAGKRSSRWVATPIVVDGNNDEWPKPYPYREEVDTRMQYAIANDSQTLYLTLKTSDETTKTKLRKNGLTVFVDTTGKKVMATSFGFSVQDDTSPERRRGHGKEGKQEDKDKQDGLANTQQLHIAGIQVTGTAFYDGNYRLGGNKPGIAAAVATNDFNELVWEIAIPLKCLYSTAADKAAQRKKISVCFTFFGLTNDDIFQLGRAVEREKQNAMPVAEIDSTNASSGAPGEDKADGNTPVRGANGGMGVGIGGSGKKKGGNDNNSAPVIDAVAAMQDRQRAGQDNQVWKQVRLSYEP